MKILQVVPYFYPAFAFGGPVRVVHALSKNLVERGHEVVVYTTDAKDINSRINDDIVTEIDGAQVHYLKNISMMTVKKSRLFVTPHLFSMIKKDIKSFDIVHLHEYRTFQNMIVCHYARKYGVPYVLQAHGSLPYIVAKQRLKWVYDVLFGYRLLRDTSKVIALNRVEADQYIGMGVPEEKIAIIPNGIDLSEYSNLPPKGSFKSKFGVGDDEKIVLYVGRLHKSKGLDLLVHAFKLVAETVNQVRLVVVGPDDGGYAATFSSLISDLGIAEKVLLTGFVEKRDKLAAFVDSDVFVTPCFSGFPVTFLESCLAGCPIVTTSNELDWINNNVGYITECSSDALAKAAVTILQDEQINRKFRKNSKHTIKKFDITTITQQLEDIYKEVAD